MQKQKNGHTGLLPNVTVIPFFPLEDVWIMVFELSLIRFAFSGVLIFKDQNEIEIKSAQKYMNRSHFIMPL